MGRWSQDEKELIMWFLKYVDERTITRSYYNKWVDEIALGPDSPRAISGELINGLKFMKKLIEEETKQIK